MNKYLTFASLILLLLLTTGFDWGFGPKDKCGEAKKIASSYADLKNREERSTAEARIQKLCPDGAASHFIKALNLEWTGIPIWQLSSIERP